MLFKPELVEQILAGEKTVTRRCVKLNGNSSPKACRYLKAKDYALQPGRGKRAVARIRILNITQEKLEMMEPQPYAWIEARKEGFESPHEFREYWEKLNGGFDPKQLVWRIEFELIDGKEGVKA